jgi:hypothetical protein
MTPEQITFVRDQLARGITVEQIKETLLSHSYTTEQVEALIVAATTVPPLAGVPDCRSTERLPSVGRFFTLVQQRMFSRPYLILLLLAYSVCLELVLFALQQQYGHNLALVVVFAVLVICSIPVSVILTATILRNLLHSAPRPLGPDYEWALKNFVSVFWVGLLVGLIVLPAFFLFLLPGLALAGYLALAQPVRIIEGVGGINALIRSTQLVRGVWWGSFLRMLAFVVPVGLVVGIIGGILNVFAGEGSLLASLMQTLIQSVMTYVMLVVTAEMYLQLSAGQPAFDSARQTPLRTTYRVFACIGPVITIMITLFVIATVVVMTSGMPLGV